MRTQTKNRLFGILLVLILTACVLLTMTPVALADEPQPELYEDADETQELEIMPVSEEDLVPTLYDDALEVMPVTADEPQPELISQQPQAASKTLPIWGWIIIIAAGAAASALVTASVIKVKAGKAAAK